MKGLQTKASKFEVKEIDGDERMVKGLASFYGNVDSDKDIIQKGAFNKSIKEWGPEGKDRIKLVAQHDMSEPVAKITKLEDTMEGLYIEAKFGTHSKGDDYYRMAKEGIINEFSVGFVPVQKEENDEGGYNIKEIKLYEVSMVTVAANDKAVVTDVKSIDGALKLVDKLEDSGTKFKLEKELLKLKSSLESDTQADSEVEASTKEESPEPTLKAEDLLTNLAKALK